MPWESWFLLTVGKNPVMKEGCPAGEGIPTVGGVWDERSQKSI